MNHSRKFCPECSIGISRREADRRHCKNCNAVWESEDNDPFDEDDELAGETDLEGKMDILLDRAFQEGGGDAR